MRIISSYFTAITVLIEPEKNILIHGIMLNEKVLFIDLFNLPDLLIDHPLATIYTSYNLVFVEDEQLQKKLDATLNHHMYLWQEIMMADTYNNKILLFNL